MPPTMLLTRPEVQSRDLADRLRARLTDVPIVVSPILEIVPVPFDAPIVPDYLVLTSAHAALAAGQVAALSGLPAYCVGDRTAEAAEAAGFAARSAAGSATDLARLLARDRPSGRGLYVRGRHVASDLPKMLSSAGLDTFSVVAYDQEERPLSAEARAALARPSPIVLPVYSPRSSALLAAAAAGAAAKIDVVAISRAAADPWHGTDAHVAISPAPDGRSMEEAIVERVRSRAAC